MKKKEAREILQVNNKGLADAIGVSEGHIRNMKSLTTTQEIIINCMVEIDRLENKVAELNKKINEITRALDI